MDALGRVSVAEPADEARADEAAASIMFGRSSLSDDIWLAMDWWLIVGAAWESFLSGIALIWDLI